MVYGIGLDIGGTKVAAGIVSSDGEVLFKKTVPTPEMGKEEILTLVKTIILELIEWADSHKVRLEGIGIGTAGQVDFNKRKVISGTPNIQNWNGVNLQEEITVYTDLPVFVDNDVNVLALAEHRFGAAQGYQEVICLALGTGIGGGILTKGELIRGAWGGGAELGHMSIDIHGEACNCGLRGCLETYASGTWIAKRMQKAREEKGLPTNVTSRDVFLLYQNGDLLATQVIETMIHGLSYGIVNLIHLFNPQVVVLGGGVMSKGQWIIDLVNKKISTMGMRSLVDSVELKLSELENDSGLIGAAMQAWLYNKKA
ncbi:ROK family protein [Lederbergia sp. NSJ-179]|uniref:ROK family protein n=1 Tax=Lederbergia sp. NSJ-179 TaxID=2931402 RepID=UPI001FD35237|nr:ROK family protein [Lederbergia sp. NSJ-179]MCJ7842741.1 ROK family protein [Lederbergia sp. NSJ-179]